MVARLVLMSKTSSIQDLFISKWQQAEERPVPNMADQSVEKSVLDAFDKHHSNVTSNLSKSGYGWFYAMAASLFIAVFSWQFFYQGKSINGAPSQPDTVLVLAINESKELETAFEQLRLQATSEFVYVQKFQLEKELILINSKLADAYRHQGSLQDKLQLWHQKNKTLSQLNALLAKTESVHATHI